MGKYKGFNLTWCPIQGVVSYRESQSSGVQSLAQSKKTKVEVMASLVGYLIILP